MGFIQYGDLRGFHRWYTYDYLGNKTTESWNFGAYDTDARTVGLTSTWSVAGELLGLCGGLGGVSYSAGARGAQGNLDEQYGNGVQATFAYDAMNRQVGRWACLYTTQSACGGGTHLEGSLAFFTGNKVTRLLNEQGDNTLGYDDLGRLSSRVTRQRYDAGLELRPLRQSAQPDGEQHGQRFVPAALVSRRFRQQQDDRLHLRPSRQRDP